MKELNLLVWVTQLGLGVALPLTCSVYAGMWLRDRFGLGTWVMVGCIILGVICAVSSLVSSMKAMEKMSKLKKEEEKPPVSFNEHH